MLATPMDLIESEGTLLIMMSRGLLEDGVRYQESACTHMRLLGGGGEEQGNKRILGRKMVKK